MTNYVRSLVQMVQSDGRAACSSPPTSTSDPAGPRHPWQRVVAAGWERVGRRGLGRATTRWACPISAGWLPPKAP